MMTLAQAQIPEFQGLLDKKHPHEILQWAWHTFGQRLAVVTSFQPTGIVTLHMLQQISTEVPIVTIDTGLLFDETYFLIDELAQCFELNLLRIKPELSVQDQASTFGDYLWESNPNACCNMRKVAPLGKALSRYEAWVTGLRQDQSLTRRDVAVVSWDHQYQMVKLCPFAEWTDEMVWDYISAHDLPYNALHDRSYPSIGCKPCTQPVSHTNGHSREGRWPGQAKTECGIHATFQENHTGSVSRSTRVE